MLIQESNRESGTQDSPRQDEDSQQPEHHQLGHKKKNLEVDIEKLTRNESVKYLGQRVSFYQQETTEIKSRIRAAWATFHKYRQELTSKNYMLKHRLRLFDATVLSDCLLRSGNLGTKQRTRENDSMDATQDATTHHPDKKEIQKDCETRYLGPKKKMEKLTSMKCEALMTKAAMARAQGLRMTWAVKFHLKTMLTKRLIQL